MLGLELADDVTAKRRRSSLLAFVIRPFRSNENPALVVGRLRCVQSWADCSPKAVLEGAILKRSPTQGDIRLASMNFQQRKL
jgi:hypothetical protein